MPFENWPGKKSIKKKMSQRFSPYFPYEKKPEKLEGRSKVYLTNLFLSQLLL